MKDLTERVCMCGVYLSLEGCSVCGVWMGDEGVDVIYH